MPCIPWDTSLVRLSDNELTKPLLHSLISMISAFASRIQASGAATSASVWLSSRIRCSYASLAIRHRGRIIRCFYPQTFMINPQDTPSGYSNLDSHCRRCFATRGVGIIVVGFYRVIPNTAVKIFADAR